MIKGEHTYLDPNCECRECLLKRQVRKVVPLEEFVGYRWNKRKFGQTGVKELGKRHRKHR